MNIPVWVPPLKFRSIGNALKLDYFFLLPLPLGLSYSNAGMDICLRRGESDLHMVVLMPLTPHHFLLH